MERFLDLNRSPNHPFEYFEESLKQTMKKQVHEYTGCETFHMKRSFTGNHSARFLIDKLFSQEEEDDDLNGVELTLSLTIGRGTNRKKKSCKNKIVYPSSIEIIDLEESSQNSTDYTNGVNLHKGSKDLHEVKIKQTKLMDFDLNKQQPSDESFHSNEPSSDLTEEKDIYTPKPIQETPKKDSDYVVKKAAHSLVSISLHQISTTNQDSGSKSGSNDTKIKKTRKQRSSSIDSYESLVLKLEERSVDEDCVTSKAFEVKEIGENKNENGIKLRRGRRLKDFQKDILPSLSSLSRHEIWEDIKILEGVIKSREYKRLQKEKTGNGENWFTPAKSQRSKVNYIGQRNCLRKRK